MAKEKVNILAIGAHPDDVELAASGTLIKHIQKGYSAAILDLTLGELGTRGNAELRTKEAMRSAEILGLSSRHQLHLGDGFFEASEDVFKQIIIQIRRYEPDTVLVNAVKDRHPDHGRASEIVSRACFLSGLSKIKTSFDGQLQSEWRPKTVYHYIQDNFIQPDVVVDVTDQWEIKMESIMAFSSQFYDPNSKEKESPISSKEFLEFLEARAANFGRLIGTKFGEGFTVERPMGIENILDLK